MGLFDVMGLTSADPSFQLGSPLFDRITISLNPDYYPGKKFVIETSGNAAESYYVESAELDGKPVDPVRIPFKDIISGGKLKVTLSKENKRSEI